MFTFLAAPDRDASRYAMTGLARGSRLSLAELWDATADYAHELYPDLY